MRRRILVAILSVTSVAIILFGVPLGLIVRRFVDDDATLRVERQAILASRDVPADFESGVDPVELPNSSDGIVFSLYDRLGRLVVGPGPSSADDVTRRALNNEVVDGEATGLRLVAVPIAVDERVVGAIRAEQSTAASDARTRRILALLAALATGVLAVGAAIGYVVAGRLALPVRRLRDAAVQLGDGNFALDVPRSKVPELDQAAQAMTATAQRLDDLVSRERSFSADASHQLRTPLAGLRATIETELQFPRQDSTVVLHEAISDIDRLQATISELLSLSRTSAITEQSTSLAAVFELLEATWQRRYTDSHRTLVLAPAMYSPDVCGTPAMLSQAMDVLLDNSLKHGAGLTTVEHAATAESVTISITDEGPGFGSMSPTVSRAQVVQTTAAVHGLGLPLARRLIEAMPGRLIVARSGANPRIDLILQRFDNPPR